MISTELGIKVLLTQLITTLGVVTRKRVGAPAILRWRRSAGLYPGGPLF
jgi:hypothetical protein